MLGIWNRELGMFKGIELRVWRSGAGVLAMLGACGLAYAEQPKQSPSPAREAQVRRDYGQLPMSFEANRGQSAEPVRFLARGDGYGLFLTGKEAVLTLRTPASKGAPARLHPYGVSYPPSGSLSGGSAATMSETQARSDGDLGRWKTDVVRMQLAGANAAVEPVGVDRLPGSSNYFFGNDPAKWHNDIPNFGKVRYAGVYPGVDLVYYGNQRQLEYDFVVAPGANSKPIRLRFAGARELKLDGDGNLAIVATNGSIAFRKPMVYQNVNGARIPIAGRFQLLANNEVGFSLGNYDHSTPLVIDPVLSYSTYFGGTDAEFVVAVTSDAAGNAYVTGLTLSEDFPLTAGAFQAVNYATPSNNVSTAFISKFNPSGTALLYSTYVGGVAISNTLHQQGDYGKAIAVDAAGNAYITGYTYSSDFPITSGAFQKGNQAAAIGLATGFVTKLNPSGTALVYSTYLGGNTLDELTALAIDSAGDAYISGISFSSNFPTTAGVLQTVNNSFTANGYNAVITKMNPTGSALIYSTYLGGGSTDGSTLSNVYWTNPIVVDKSGNAYVAGFSSSGDFPVTAGAYQAKNGGSVNITVSKLNPTATALIYSTYLGGNTISYCEGLAVDSAGNAYVAGYTSDLDFPVTKGAFQLVNKADQNTDNSADSNQNGFLTKINPTGTGLVYSTYLGGTTGPWGGDQIYDLAIDSAGDAYVVGSAMSADFPVTSNAYQATNKGASHCCDYATYTSNGFLTEFNPAGTALIYSTYFGGTGVQTAAGPGGSGDTAYGLALGANSNVYLVGYTTSSNFPVTVGAFETAYHTQQNTGFVADFDLAATPPTTKDTETALTPSANSVAPGTAVTFTVTVKPTSGTVIPTGNMVFSVDEVPVATVALSAGTAAYTNSTLAAGQHYVLASYSGSTEYEASGDGFNEIVSPIKPVISPASGTYYAQQSVTITEATAASPLYYTLDGSPPTVFSTAYTTPIAVNTSKTVAAVAVAEHDATSSEVSATYTIVGSPTVLAGPATAVGTTGATLNAYVNTAGVAGSYSFRYGTTSTALTTATATTALSASINRATATATLSTLTANTTYYYQVEVTTAGGTTAGAVQSFTTQAGSGLATLTSPAPGSVLGGPGITFMWSPATGSGIQGYWLFLGTTGVGSKNLFDSGQQTATSATYSSLPTNGETIYARLYTSFNGTLVYNDYTYKAAAQAVLTSPAPGGVLAGPSVTFTWTSATGAGNQGYWLFLGTTGVGSKNLYDSGQQTTTSDTFSNLPTNGETIYARVYTSYNGTLVYNDYTYRAASQAVLTTPTPGSSLTGSSATFTWTAASGSGNQGYWLYLGTTGVGSKDLYDSGQQTATSATFNKLPTDGATIYARLYTRYNGTLVYNDYRYTAWMQPPTLTSPTPGSTFTGPSATFTWTAEAGSQGYWLFLGTTGAGSRNLYDSGQQAATSATFNSLPTNGETIYARVYTRYNGVLVYNDYTYEAK